MKHSTMYRSLVQEGKADPAALAATKKNRILPRALRRAGTNGESSCPSPHSS